MARLNVGTGSGNRSSGGGGCGGAVLGVLLGLIMIPVGFYVAYHGEARLVDHSKVFESVEMSSPEAAVAMDGELVKFSGEPQGQFLTIPQAGGEFLYWTRQLEEYVEEEDSDGNVEYRWRSRQSETHWVDAFEIGSISVRPDGAHPVGRREVYSAYKRRYETSFRESTQPGTPEVGDQRETIDVLRASTPAIVLGEMSNGSVQGGSSFIVSTLNEQQTQETLRSEYVAAYWGLKAGAVALIFFGIMSVFGPLTKLVGYVPLVGDGLSCAFSAAAFVFAVVSVTIITVFMQAFWVLVALALLAVAFMIFRGVTTPRNRPGSEAEIPAPDSSPSPGGATPPPPTGVAPEDEASRAVPRPVEASQPAKPVEDTPSAPVAPPPGVAEEQSEDSAPSPGQEGASAGPKFCAGCGSRLVPGGKFCGSCGENVQ